MRSRNHGPNAIHSLGVTDHRSRLAKVKLYFAEYKTFISGIFEFHCAYLVFFDPNYVPIISMWPHLIFLPVHQQKTDKHSESGNSDLWNEMSRISFFNAILNRSADLVSWLAQQGRNHETIYFCAFRGFCQLRKISRENKRSKWF